MKNIYTTQYKIADNRGYEEYLSNGVIVEVIERIRVEQDELLKTRIIMKDGNPLWIRGICVQRSLLQMLSIQQ